ncbi:DNA-3-methyladenine glycosylase family protein [Kordiimonas pumila]|uniref:DNA-3-methyladenine glycosylase II n=1 Tax=Kordiimonas pumila TaxID=2161677 RepID=A0ABV7D045_9PROT|nr:DNA-3-methyladenine glycosylase 2 family protein [Kordiimonas pumila]
MNFILNTAAIKESLLSIASTDTHVATALDTVGYPSERTNPQGFTTLLKVIVGQQLSVKAAATIWGRVQTLAGENASPDAYAVISDEALRVAGLSRQKIAYFRSLCEHVTGGTLDLEALAAMPDENVIAAITSVKGLGVWSAHMYLMFSLGRPDIWPVGDLAVRAGIGRIINHTERPTEKQLQIIGDKWRPHRSAMALLAWHYYSNAPL